VNARVFVGAARATAIPADDRGFGYGDGLFETMRAHRGGVPWWDAHWSRLARGAARLQMALPDENRVRAEAVQLLDGGHGVLKLIVSRGSGARGYAPDDASSPNWVLSHHPVPAPLPRSGLVLRWCETRLALQPALAGIKHCNRLEQVLARAEWRDLQTRERKADEGLMRSTEGDVVCATAANLFIFAAGCWMTPRIDRCGVEGVCRGWAMAASAASETRLMVGDIESAEAVFLCNAARGILPVARLGAKAWPPHPQVAALQQRLSVDHPAFNILPTELS
jgi:4-amino-4-deoxychorismate lyase